MTRKEAQEFIEGKKICAGFSTIAVNDKLNEIFDTNNPTPDYPFVYIIDGKPVWGSSPRKFNCTDMVIMNAEELLDIEIETPVEYPIGTVLVDRYATCFAYVGAPNTVTFILSGSRGSFVSCPLDSIADVTVADEEETDEFYQFLQDHGLTSI